jgi:hypothetical protein
MFNSLLRLRAITLLVLANAIVISAPKCWAAKDFVMPKAEPAKTYPAHDVHPTEAAALGLEPYDTPEKAKIFSVHYRDINFVPIFVVITNDSDQPISLAGMKAELVTSDRTKISPATQDDIFRRISRPQANTSSYPLPFPTRKVKGGVSEQAREELENSRFGAEAVEPHSTQVGFMFFDIYGIPKPLSGAHFYLTGVRDAKGNELMYFDVPLDDYLNAPANP